MVAGKANMVDVVTAVSETEVAVETMVAVRNKVIQAYQRSCRCRSDGSGRRIAMRANRPRRPDEGAAEPVLRPIATTQEYFERMMS